MKDINLYKNLDEFVTGESKSELIRKVFENKTKSNLSKKKIKKMETGGGVGTSSEVYSPYEFLYELLPKVYGRDYIVSDDQAEKWDAEVSEQERELNSFIASKLAEANVSRIYDLNDESVIENIEVRKRQIASRKAYISESELQAYLFCHPEINHEFYTKKTNFDKDYFLAKGLIMADYDRETASSKFVYRYEYLSGNLYEKQNTCRIFSNQIISDLGVTEQQIEKQISELNKFKPEQALITEGEYNRIYLHPMNEFCMSFMIHSNDWNEYIQVNGSNSILNAFNWWVSYQMDSSLIKYSDSKRAIIKYFSNLERENTREFINNRRRAFQDGDIIFNIFLNEALNQQCRDRIQYEWNEKYNSFTEQMYYKIPVALTLSKTFKKGDEFLPNETQVQSVPFIRDAGSGLLAYGVGVGKTASSIMNLSYALDHGLCEKAIFVVPNPTYAKWIKEIEGGEEITYQVSYIEDGKTFTSDFLDEKVAKKFSSSVNGTVTVVRSHIQGILPHLPKIVGLFNLGVDYVKQIKEYDEQEKEQMKNAESLVEYVKGLPVTYEFDDASVNANIKRFYDDFELDALKDDYQSYFASEAKKQKTEEPKVIPILKFFKNICEAYRRELPYILGTIKEFPKKTIFICTYEALGYLGLKLNDADDLINNQSTFGKLFTELTQGELVENFQRMGKVNMVSKTLANVLHGTEDKRKIDLYELGVDYGVFDESHTFKKVFTESKGLPKQFSNYPDGHGRIEREVKKYQIGATDGKPTPLALGGWVVTRLIQMKNDGKNVIHLTATPFTNKPAEIYSMLALVNYKRLKAQGFQYAQDFFELFMKMSYDLVVTPAQKIVRKEQLVGFNNLSQMRRIIYTLMDYKSGDDANIKRPIKILYPSLVDGRDTSLPATTEQEEVFKNIKKYVYGDIGYSELCSDETDVDVDEMSFEQLLEYVENHGSDSQKEKYSVVDFDEMTDDDISELRRIVQKLVEKESKDAIDETEINEEEEKAFVRVMRGISLMKQVTLSPYLSTCQKERGNEPTAKEYVESSPKLLYALGLIKSVHDYENEQNPSLQKSGIVLYMNLGVHPSFKGQKWSEGGFEKVKKYMVEEMGYNPNEISIVHGKITREQKEKEKNKFLAGQSTVLIGSSTISTGVDLQNNSSALINCTFDWNPTDNEQINGRIHRQGNRFRKVRIVYPMIINSADPLIFETLNEKANRIKSIWDKDDKGTTLDLKDFDPNKLKKDLLDDPEQKANIWFSEKDVELEDEIIILGNRQKKLRNTTDDLETLKQKTPVVQGLLTIIDAFKKERERKKIESRVAEKIGDAETDFSVKKAELFQKLQDDDDFAPKYAEEMKKAKEKFEKVYQKAIEGEYDFKNDPEGKYVYEDFYNMSDEMLLTKVNSQILNSDSWWNKNIVNDYDTRNEIRVFVKDKFPRFYEGYWGQDYESYFSIYWNSSNLYEIINVSQSWKGALRNKKNIQDSLAIMGIDVDQISEASNMITQRIEELKLERESLREKIPEKFEQFTQEFIERRMVAPTISERIQEFGNMNYILHEVVKPFEEDKAKVVKTYSEELEIKPNLEEVKEVEEVSEKEFLEAKIEAFEDMLDVEENEDEINFLKEKIEAFKDMLDLI